ncbi:MAG: translocation/assembly module TamB domain-containing protein [Sandaracinus sp.]
MGVERSVRRWRRWAAVLAIFAIGIPLFSATVIRSSGAATRIRTLATEAIRDELGLRATLGPVQLQLVPLAIVAREIALDDPVYGRLADAESLTIRPSFLALLRGRVDITSIELDRASVSLVISEGRIRNLPTIDTGEGGGEITLPFHRFEIRDSVLVVHGAPDFEAELRGVSAEVTGEADHVIAIRASATSGFVEHGPEHAREELTELSAGLEVASDHVGVAEAGLAIGPLAVHARDVHVPLPFPSDPRAIRGLAIGEARVDYDVGHIASLHLPITLPRFAGVAHVRVTADDDGTRQHATVGVDVEHGRIEQFGLGDHVHLALDVTPERAEITEGLVDVQGGGGHLALSGDLGLATDDFPLDVRATLDHFSFAHLMDQFEVSDSSIVEWIFEGTLDLRGSLARLDLEGPIDLRTHDFTVSANAYDERPLRTVLAISHGHFGGRWSIRDDAVRFSDVVADLPHSRLFADVLLGFHNALGVDVHAEADMRDASPLAGFDFAGIGTATCHIGGTFQAPNVSGHVHLADFEFDHFRMGEVESDAILDPDGMAVTFPIVTAVKRDSRYSVSSLRLDFHPGGRRDRFELNGDLHMDRMTLADFYHVFHFEEDERFIGYQGAMRGDARLHYTHGFDTDSPNGTLTTEMELGIETLSINGYAFENGTLGGSWTWYDWGEGYRGGQLVLDHVELHKGEGSVTIAGTMQPGGSLRMFAAADRIALRDVEGIGDTIAGLDGIAEATADIGGTAERMRVDMDASLTDLVYLGRTIGDARAYVRMTHDADPWVTDALAWETAEDGSPIAPEGEACPLARIGLARGGWRPDPPLHTVDGLQPSSSGESAFIVCGSGLDGHLNVDLAIGRTRQLPLRGRIALDGFDVTPYLPSGDTGETAELAAATGRSGGLVTAEVVLTDGGMRDLEELGGRIRIPQLELRRGDLAFHNASPIEIRLEDGVAHVERARLRGPGARVRARGTVGVTSGLGLELEADVDLGIATQLTSAIDAAAGTATMRMALSGPFADPELFGEARIENGVIEARGLAVSGLAAHATFSSRRVLLDSLRADVAGGTIEASGEGTLEERALSRYAIDIAARDLSLTPTEGLEVALGVDAHLAWAQGERLPRVTGDVRVSRLAYTDNIELGTTLGELTRTERAEVTSYDPDNDHVEIDLRVRQEEPFLVRNNLIDATISIADDDRPFRIVGTDQRYGVVGDMRFSRGRIFFRNASFEMRNGGLLSFDSEERVDPHFDVHATTEIRRSGDLTAPSWRVMLDASGSRDAFRIVTRSDPDLPQEDILLLLTIGMTRIEAEALRGGDLGGTAALEALATVTGVDREVRRALPVIDEFHLTSAYSVRALRTVPQVSIAKRIADRVRLSATTALSETREFRAQIEAQLSDTTSVQVGYDNYNLTSASSFGNVGADLRFRLEFE